MKCIIQLNKILACLLTLVLPIHPTYVPSHDI